jgi:hypothetical protein
MNEQSATYATKDKLQTILTQVFDEIESEQKKKKRFDFSDVALITLVSSVTSAAVTSILFLLLMRI